eukprot:PhM_4_TR17177/c0_g1_i1/m.22889
MHHLRRRHPAPLTAAVARRAHAPRRRYCRVRVGHGAGLVRLLLRLAKARHLLQRRSLLLDKSAACCRLGDIRPPHVHATERHRRSRPTRVQRRAAPTAAARRLRVLQPHARAVLGGVVADGEVRRHHLALVLGRALPRGLDVVQLTLHKLGVRHELPVRHALTAALGPAVRIHWRAHIHIAACLAADAADVQHGMVRETLWRRNIEVLSTAHQRVDRGPAVCGSPTKHNVGAQRSMHQRRHTDIVLGELRCGHRDVRPLRALTPVQGPDGPRLLLVPLRRGVRDGGTNRVDVNKLGLHSRGRNRVVQLVVRRGDADARRRGLHFLRTVPNSRHHAKNNNKVQKL